jgi:hypothetical protein
MLKGTKMARMKSEMAMVAFKVEEELAALLNELPNKSEFIRKAIAAQLGLSCPLCHGKGAISGWLHLRYSPLLQSLKQQGCAGCGSEQRIPTDPGGLDAGALARLEQFFHGGPLYCESCFRDAEECTDCGLHLDQSALKEHRKKLHAPRSQRRPPSKEP